MADRTTNITIESRVRGRSAVQIADGVTIGIGALVQLESGYLNHWSSAGANTFLGILIGGENVDANGAPVGERPVFQVLSASARFATGFCVKAPGLELASAGTCRSGRPRARRD